MIRNHLTFIIVLPFLLLENAAAKIIVDCRVVTGGITECNPYGQKFVKVREIKYETNRHKLIAAKTLPVPPKTSIKVISVEDMIEKYVKIEEPVRFKGTEPITIQPVISKETQKERMNSRIEKLRIHRRVLLEKMQKIKEEKERKKQEALKIVKEKEEKKEETLKPAQKQVIQGGYYVIEEGDSISTIAAKFGIKRSTLRALNHLEKGAAIRIGKKLIIPYSQKRVDTIAKAEYIVEAGDNLGSIAKDFNLSSDAIIKLNRLKKNAPIRIGQKILLPLPHKLAQQKAEQKRLLAKHKKERLAKSRSKKVKKYTYRSKMIHGFGKRKLRVTATAYSSHRRQTDNTPFLAAWNNRIRPGMKIIAVSRDMLTRYGLRNGSRVRIGGLPGYYTVRDKMNKRFRRRIDIYMGTNRRRALRWGRRSVMLYW
ncbi:LysM peptidoglycan-binding domain-containing protein [Sulfurovum sp.]|uniref:LysM peptidoglycan-binding domain-containing protein n=1 Tax=Sulfurovum sp. TaxID=1969726 RepID=UPI0025E15199|nr:LysM peptidoglycan-binding domain-containing protein [Sulfurovum sp.]